MRTHLRDPDCFTLAVNRGPVRGETSVQMHHEEGGLTVVLWDDWAPCRELDLPPIVERAVRLWLERGPLAAASYMNGVKAARRR